MPVFHTKTIESILEPVAQQVSKLVILHEEAEDGNAMPSLARPVQVVKLAVDNLIKVGYETINNSEDAILKQDMPPALSRVEDASILLLDASEMLHLDPYSAAARKKLIEGSRGILQGTSALLLAFDESEVRKIVRICKNVLEYLAITEVVETLEDLVTFVKNLSPVLTRMAKEVDAREKELTHQIHREWLQRSLEQVKQLTPALISGIKIFVTTKNQAGDALGDAQSSRDYVTNKMADEIHELIRVLQLTTYDEDEWDADDITVIKRAQNAIEGKMKQAYDWLSDPQALVGSAGENAVRQILADALRIADRCIDIEDRDRITKNVSNINSMLDALCELRQQGKGDSSQAMSLSRGMQQLLKELEDTCLKAVQSTDKTGVMKPAHTMLGKLEQSERWLANPAIDDKGLGQQACLLLVEEGRRIANGMSGSEKTEMLQLCTEVESLTDQLSDLASRGMSNTPQSRYVAAGLSQKLEKLKSKIQDEVTAKVADDFMDITSPLKALSEAAMLPLGVPYREANYESRAENFAGHVTKMAATANLLARSGNCNDRRTIEAIRSTAQIVDDLIPHIIKAGHMVLLEPSNENSLEHFDLLKKQFVENAEKLRSLTDVAIDAATFIKQNEIAILRDTERTEQNVRDQDSSGVVTYTSNIARRAHRILQVAQSEADNSEDVQYVGHLNDSIIALRNTIAPMIQSAKGLAQNPQDINCGTRWRSTNQQLIESVGDVRNAVRGHDFDNDRYYASPDISNLNLSNSRGSAPPVPPLPQKDDYYGTGSYRDYADQAPPRPPLPKDTVPPRPPPPETDDEFEASFPAPQANQPIMMAAHALHMDVKQWSSRDNELIAAAKRMALLMARLSQLVRGENGTKKKKVPTATLR